MVEIRTIQDIAAAAPDECALTCLDVRCITGSMEAAGVLEVLRQGPTTAVLRKLPSVR